MKDDSSSDSADEVEASKQTPVSVQKLDFHDDFTFPAAKTTAPGNTLPAASKELSTSSSKPLLKRTTPGFSVQMPTLPVEPITAKMLRKYSDVILSDMVTTLKTQLNGPKTSPRFTAPPKTRRIDPVLRETTVAMPDQKNAERQRDRQNRK